MSYQQSINNAWGSVARLFAVGKGLSEASKIRGSTERQEQRLENWVSNTAYKDVGGTYTYGPVKVPEEVIHARKMREANERAERKQELRRIQKENMAYFAGKFWKEQK